MTQLSESVVPITYVGKKAVKFDNVNHTGTQWRPGETVLYPARHARALLVHTDVWRIGKAEDLKSSTKDEQTVVAAGAGEQATETGATGQGRPSDKEEPGPSQSEQVKDRAGSTKGGGRKSLE